MGTAHPRTLLGPSHKATSDLIGTDDSENDRKKFRKESKIFLLTRYDYTAAGSNLPVVQRHSVRLYISPPITSNCGLCRTGQPNITFWMVYTHSQRSSFTGFWSQPICSQAQCAARYQLTYLLHHPSHSHAYTY
jgi:hypothetical protein